MYIAKNTLKMLKIQVLDTDFNLTCEIACVTFV